MEVNRKLEQGSVSKSFKFQGEEEGGKERKNEE